ncbi:MAG: hypothetical protein JWQ38_3367 [Flavipsychrobacter sp.]|nr:hypothetical protein [Flavipsychrobacter sp.]
MKSIVLLLGACILSVSTLAQHTVRIRNLWAKPQVNVAFEHYTVSFTIKDINRALLLLAEIGDSTYGLTSKLDEQKKYYINLYRGRTEYTNDLQPMMQHDLGAFLLTAGHAVVKRKHHKALKEIIVDIGTPSTWEKDVIVTVYDPKKHKAVFQGKMKIDMYNKDLGIE